MEADEYLWMDKYQPKSLNALDFNKNVTNIGSCLSKKEDFPHLIFYGPDGAGKKTRIHAFLESIYGPGVHKVNTEIRELKNNSTTIQYGVTSSNYHLELTPSESENYDRIIIQKVIKETSSVAQLDTKSQKSFKVIVLLEVDSGTKDAQAALRRTMEKYSRTCRIIMSCNSLTKIIPPIRSRCLSLRVSCPEEKDIRNFLSTVAKREMISISDQNGDGIVKNSERNTRKAINTLQMTTLDAYKKEVYVPEYLLSIKAIAKEAIKGRSANDLRKGREDILKGIVNGISGQEIIGEVTKELLDKVSNQSKKSEIINWAAEFDNRIMNGSKAIFHLEAFLARVMLINSK